MFFFDIIILFHCSYLSTGISFRQVSSSMCISKSDNACSVKETNCAMWTALRVQLMPSLTEQIFKETAKGISTWWNFPNYFGSVDRKHISIKCLPNWAVNILTTNCTVHLFCRLLWVQILNLWLWIRNLWLTHQWWWYTVLDKSL